MPVIIDSVVVVTADIDGVIKMDAAAAAAAAAATATRVQTKEEHNEEKG